VGALISTQHQDGVDRDTVIRPDLIEQVIRPVVPPQFADDDYNVYINPTGKFVIGGPVGDKADKPKDGGTADALVKSADQAMYRAKQNRSGYSFAR
jgi:GGDEF domain-containing protein